MLTIIYHIPGAFSRGFCFIRRFSRKQTDEIHIASEARIALLYRHKDTGKDKRAKGMKQTVKSKGAGPQEKMRVSFDLDEVLFVSPKTHKTEPPLKFPFNKIYKERLRLGTPDLIKSLQRMGYEVWVYTSSFRSERYIKGLFRMYGVRFDGIVNGTRHLKEVQRNNKTTLPQKLPNRYRISLHIDDEEVICSLGHQYGFKAYQLYADDDEWKEKIIRRAEEIRKMTESA